MTDLVRSPRAFAITIITRMGVPPWHMDFDDLINEGYLGYMAAQRSYNPGKCSFSHWAYVKMRGYILNYLIRKSSRDHLNIDDLIRKPYTPSYESLILDSIDLQRAMNKLTPRTREILWLQYRDGLNHREIGRVYGLAKSSISSIHVKALWMLRRELL
jgi:RNA polymerase sigma factor (sigma-70 family)